MTKNKNKEKTGKKLNSEKEEVKKEKEKEREDEPKEKEKEKVKDEADKQEKNKKVLEKKKEKEKEEEDNKNKPKKNNPEEKLDLDPEKKELPERRARHNVKKIILLWILLLVALVAFSFGSVFIPTKMPELFLPLIIGSVVISGVLIGARLHINSHVNKNINAIKETTEKSNKKITEDIAEKVVKKEKLDINALVKDPSRNNDDAPANCRKLMPTIQSQKISDEVIDGFRDKWTRSNPQEEPTTSNPKNAPERTVPAIIDPQNTAKQDCIKEVFKEYVKQLRNSETDKPLNIENDEIKKALSNLLGAALINNPNPTIPISARILTFLAFGHPTESFEKAKIAQICKNNLSPDQRSNLSYTLLNCIRCMPKVRDAQGPIPRKEAIDKNGKKIEEVTSERTQQLLLKAAFSELNQSNINDIIYSLLKIGDHFEYGASKNGQPELPSLDNDPDALRKFSLAGMCLSSLPENQVIAFLKALWKKAQANAKKNPQEAQKLFFYHFIGMYQSLPQEWQELFRINTSGPMKELPEEISRQISNILNPQKNPTNVNIPINDPEILNKNNSKKGIEKGKEKEKEREDEPKEKEKETDLLLPKSSSSEKKKGDSVSVDEYTQQCLDLWKPDTFQLPEEWDLLDKSEPKEESHVDLKGFSNLPSIEKDKVKINQTISGVKPQNKNSEKNSPPNLGSNPSAFLSPQNPVNNSQGPQNQTPQTKESSELHVDNSFLSLKRRENQ